MHKKTSNAQRKQSGKDKKGITFVSLPAQTTVCRQISKLFCRETIAWKHLSHPSIVPFAGVTLEPLQLVSEWMPGGELRRYIQKNPGANLIHLVGSFLLYSAQPLTRPSVTQRCRRPGLSSLMRGDTWRSQRGGCRY